jgi:hypothetical protein
MRAFRALNLSLGLAAALLLAGCARSVDMSLASLHQRTPEFDFLLYQDGWACLSRSAPGRDAACAPTSGRQLRELFSERSGSRSLRDYLAENGAGCRSASGVTTCSYVKILDMPSLPGRQGAPSPEHGVELTVSFPADDQGLTPEQIRTALRRFTRTL